MTSNVSVCHGMKGRREPHVTASGIPRQDEWSGANRRADHRAANHDIYFEAQKGSLLFSFLIFSSSEYILSDSRFSFPQTS